MPAKADTKKINVRSSLRLFLSIDIVGSTEFKQARSDTVRSTADWVEPFLSFYQISVDKLEAEWSRVCEAMKQVEPSNKSERFAFGDCPEFWKGAGDEVLFSKVIRSPLDAMAALHSLLALMEEHRRRFRSKHSRLDVKGAAWLAGFPVNNAEIILPVRAGRKVRDRLDDPIAENYRLLSLYNAAGASKAAYHADYIGPSIDLGFRLREHSTPRRLVVSSDLVWLLCHAHRACSDDERNRCSFLQIPHVGYDGRHGLRGILGGEPYPLMWIESDTNNPIDRAEDLLLNRELAAASSSSTTLESLWHFCNQFLNGLSPLRMKPYIPGWIDPDVGTVSTIHRERLKDIRTYVNGAGTQLGSLAVSDKASGPIPIEAERFASGVAREVGSARASHSRKTNTRSSRRTKS